MSLGHSRVEWKNARSAAILSLGQSPVISAGMPKSSVQGWQTLAYYIAQMKHLYNRQVTVHGLDTGIPAGMTVFLARQDLCITMRAELGSEEKNQCRSVKMLNRGLGDADNFSFLWLGAFSH